MNKQIYEMAKQAGFDIDTAQTQHNGHILSNSLERFASSIVRQCADIIEAQDVDPAFKLRMSWAMKKHFEIED